MIDITIIIIIIIVISVHPFWCETFDHFLPLAISYIRS